jgi:hypothetical protein
MRYAFIGISPPTATTVTNPLTLDVRGVRYVLAMPDDAVSDRLHLIRTIGGVRIFENPDPWPEAIFVKAFPQTPMPRVPDCGNDRFLCVDFDRAGIERDPAGITIDRHRDGLTLRFAPSDSPRHLLVTQWYQPYWRVNEGRLRSCGRPSNSLASKYRRASSRSRSSTCPWSAEPFLYWYCD